MGISLLSRSSSRLAQLSSAERRQLAGWPLPTAQTLSETQYVLLETVTAPALNSLLLWDEISYTLPLTSLSICIQQLSLEFRSRVIMPEASITP